MRFDLNHPNRPVVVGLGDGLISNHNPYAK